MIFIYFIYFILIIITLQLYCFYNNKSLHEILYPNDYKIIFNENKYKPTQNIIEYNKIVKRGYEIMKTKKIVIGGLFYNSSKVFNKFKNRMNYLQNYFKDIQIVIFENDSIDNSRILLLNWEKQQKNINIIKCKENNFCLLNKKKAISHGIFSNCRMKKMSQYRNIVKKYVDDNFSNYDYFIVIDTDARGAFSLDGLAYSFGINTEWDVMSAYGSVGIVLTLGNLIYHDYIAYLDNYISIESLKKIIAINLTNKNDDIIKVNEAFGGLSIYKMSSIKNSDYTPHDNNYICEHTIFTNNMKMNGYNKFYINPKLIFLMGKQGPDYLFFY